MENTDSISRLTLALRPIFQKYRIQKAILFGSWATEAPHGVAMWT